MIKVGDKVIYDNYTGVEIKLSDGKYIIIAQSELLAIVD